MMSLPIRVGGAFLLQRYYEKDPFPNRKSLLARKSITIAALPNTGNVVTVIW